MRGGLLVIGEAKKRIEIGREVDLDTPPALHQIIRVHPIVVEVELSIGTDDRQSEILVGMGAIWRGPAVRTVLTDGFRPGPSDPHRDLVRASIRRDWKFVILFAPRSEEHTSELQSPMRISYAVLCLQKKKTCNYTHVIKRLKE